MRSWGFTMTPFFNCSSFSILAIFPSGQLSNNANQLHVEKCLTLMLNGLKGVLFYMTFCLFLLKGFLFFNTTFFNRKMFRFSLSSSIICCFVWVWERFILFFLTSCASYFFLLVVSPYSCFLYALNVLCKHHLI